MPVKVLLPRRCNIQQMHNPGELRLTLPYPVSSNRYWRSARGRVFVSAEAKHYKGAVLRIASPESVFFENGDVIVHVDVYRPAKRRDLDNCLKVLLDSLNGVCWKDDSQIVEIHARRFEDKENPRAEVVIMPAK